MKPPFYVPQTWPGFLTDLSRTSGTTPGYADRAGPQVDPDLRRQADMHRPNMPASVDRESRVRLNDQARRCHAPNWNQFSQFDDCGLCSPSFFKLFNLTHSRFSPSCQLLQVIHFLTSCYLLCDLIRARVCYQ